MDAVEQAVYHDVDDNELSMLLRVHQNNGRALPIGSFTERKISQVVQGATGVAPTASTQPSGAQLEDLSSIKIKTKKMINTIERGK